MTNSWLDRMKIRSNYRQDDRRYENLDGFRRGGRIERRPLQRDRWDDYDNANGWDDYKYGWRNYGRWQERQWDDEEYFEYDWRQRNRWRDEERQRDRWRDDDFDNDWRETHNYPRRSRRPKVEIPRFSGGDPYEWLDKVDHYFQVYEVSKEDKVSIACIYLDGKANRWWKWLRALYDEEERYLGWTAFEREFLRQWSHSPVVNHHEQLAKLRQEGKVQAYIDEFQRLQTLVRGWSEETLLGAFIEGLKPWLCRELKWKQPPRLSEAMRLAELLEDGYLQEKKLFKESSRIKDSKNSTLWKGLESADKGNKKEDIEGELKKGGREVKELTIDQVQINSADTNDDNEDEIVREEKVNHEEKIDCEQKINGQDVGIVVDLHVLSSVGVDFVFGDEWRNNIGKANAEFKRTMDPKLGGRKRHWTTLSTKKRCVQMMEVLSKNDHDFAFISAGDNYARGNEIDEREREEDRGISEPHP